MAKPVQYHDGRFPPESLEWKQLIPLIGPANAALARFDGTLGAIPNAAVLLSPLTTQEAVLSSKIEGTQATMGEVLEYEARGETDDPGSEREADIWEVLNYRRAMNLAVDSLKEMPLCLRLVREVHEVLLNSVRGHGKSPGKYRRIPNWIGPPGCAIDDASFVPIDAARLPDAMSRWEKYIHAETPDSLVQLAILHAEFEALHPFLDGNGRLGRMLVPLYMFHAKLIQSPMFYISAFFEARREEYYDKLLAVSKDDDWTGWCVFFLNAVKAQAEDNQNKATAILKLYNEMKVRVTDLTHSQYSIHTLDWVFNRPVFKSTDFVKDAGITVPTAKRILQVLKQEGILKTLDKGGGRKAAVLAFSQLLNIAEGHKAF